MTAEFIRVVLRLDRDPRLAAAVRRAVRFQSLHAGLDEGSCDALAGASEEVCFQTLARLPEAEVGLQVTLDTFCDRIEVSIHHPAPMVPPVGLDAFAVPRANDGNSNGVNGTELMARVDKVMFDAHDGVARTTLVKFLRSNR